MTNRFKAIIFDLDGTLINTLEDIANSMNSVLHRCGYPEHALNEYKIMVGEGLRNLTQRCLPESERADENISRCLAMMMDEYGRRYVEKSHLYNGIDNLLNSLTVKELKLSILSNKADALTQKICAQLLNSWHFEIIMGYGEKFPRKPNPASALHIAQSMNVQPRDIIYLGDTAIDMQTAGAAGMFAVGATWGFRDREELLGAGAKLIIDEPMELINNEQLTITMMNYE